MSLDIYLEEVKLTTVFESNITHNVVPMWNEAGIYDALYNNEGTPAWEILPILLKGLNTMKNEPERFRPLSAKNGWGTYDQAVPWLENLIKGFEENPNAVIRVSK